MGAPYLPPSGNVTSSVDMFTWINGVVENWFFPGMIISVWFILLIKMLFSSQGNTVSKSFAAASFIAMITSVMCRLLGFVSTTFMTIWIFLTAGSVIWMFVEEVNA